MPKTSRNSHRDRVPQGDRSSHARVWLAAGLFLGLGLALWSVLEQDTPPTGLPETAAARVNAHVIPRREYARALNAVAADTREPLDAADRSRVLERLINEELLVQHALSLGLAHDTPRIRDLLVDAIFEGIRTETETAGIGEAEAREYLKNHPERFRGPPLLRVRVLRADSEDAARQAIGRLRSGEAWSSVQADLDSGGPPLPDTLLPADKLRDYLGPGLTHKAQSLKTGSISEPIPHNGRHHILTVRERRPAAAPPFDQIAEAVRQRMRREMAERALRQRLDELREQARISIADDLD